MTSPFGPLRLISNPTAGRGRDAVLPRLRAALDARGLEHDVAITHGPGHAPALARDAVLEDGIRFVVAVGGDGTVHEVVNGLVDPRDGPIRDDLVFGAVSAGSGSDFVRTFGLDLPPERVARHLDGDSLYPIDVGRVRLTGMDGSERTTCFVNIAEAGYGAIVVDRVRRLPRFLGQSRYLLGMYAAIRTFTTQETTVLVDHAEVTDQLCNVVVANGQFFGGNMKIAPRALPDDGKFNVKLFRGTPMAVFLHTPKLRKGEDLPRYTVAEYQSSRVEVRARDPILVEADGEVLGTTTAVFDLLPRAISLKI